MVICLYSLRSGYNVVTQPDPMLSKSLTRVNLFPTRHLPLSALLFLAVSQLVSPPERQVGTSASHCRSVVYNLNNHADRPTTTTLSGEASRFNRDSMKHRTPVDQPFRQSGRALHVPDRPSRQRRRRRNRRRPVKRSPPRPPAAKNAQFHRDASR